jgi:hypothetical protein
MNLINSEGKLYSSIRVVIRVGSSKKAYLCSAVKILKSSEAGVWSAG